MAILAVRLVGSGERGSRVPLGGRSPLHDGPRATGPGVRRYNTLGKAMASVSDDHCCRPPASFGRCRYWAATVLTSQSHRAVKPTRAQAWLGGNGCAFVST